jgi:serine/threonine-protein kinase HipA
MLGLQNNSLTLCNGWPAYDLLCTKLALPEDPEEMALTLNGKKRKFRRQDFDALATGLKIPERTVINTYTKFSKRLPGALSFVDQSFLPVAMMQAYRALLHDNAKRLGLLESP